MSQKLAVVLGIRPDVVRASLILRELRDKLGDDLCFIWSGQHYSDNMKDIFFRQLDVPTPNITLTLETGNDTALIGSIVSQLGNELRNLKPAAVVFLGDTNTVLGSLAAASLDIPIVHIEGCMRSYDWRMPEEKFRTTIDHLADVIYAYLPEYKEQGVVEGLDPARIIVSGNPIVDVLQHYFESGIVRMNEVDISNLMKSVGITSSTFWLMTCHRRENIESKKSLENIMALINSVPGTVVFPAGYRTQEKIKSFEIDLPPNMKLIDPIGYAELLELMARSQTVITDSGTVVEEASVLQIPSIQMRTSTERPQVYDSGGSLKFDPHSEYSEAEMRQIIFEAQSRLGRKWAHELGDGSASQKIVTDLLRRLKNEDWRGHLPNEKLRPIQRNYGYGLSGLGKA